MEGGKGSLLGWAELPVTEMETSQQASYTLFISCGNSFENDTDRLMQGQIARLERKLEDCSRPGAKISIAARILYF